MSKELLRVTWAGGSHRAEVVFLDDDRVSLLSSRAFAPGSRPEGVLGTGAALRLKTARCRLATEAEQAGTSVEGVGDGSWFLLEGRLLDASRALRTALTEALRPVPNAPEPNAPAPNAPEPSETESGT